MVGGHANRRSCYIGLQNLRKRTAKRYKTWQILNVVFRSKFLPFILCTPVWRGLEFAWKWFGHHFSFQDVESADLHKLWTPIFALPWLVECLSATSFSEFHSSRFPSAATVYFFLLLLACYNKVKLRGNYATTCFAWIGNVRQPFVSYSNGIWNNCLELYLYFIVQFIELERMRCSCQTCIQFLSLSSDLGIFLVWDRLFTLSYPTFWYKCWIELTVNCDGFKSSGDHFREHWGPLGKSFSILMWKWLGGSK